MKDQVACLRASLKAAPAKVPPARSAKAIIAAMRADLVKARREKNWSNADLREWLAQEGVAVSEETLRKYLATPGGAVGRESAGRSAASSGVKPLIGLRAAGRKPAVAATGQATKERVPRASSFPVREDTPDI